MATERIPQGGALAVYDPLVAAQGYLRDPRASYDAYGRRQVQSVGQNLSNMLGTTGTRTAQTQQQAGMLFPRAGMFGGALAAAPSVLGAIQSAREERPLEAGVTAAVGVPAALGAAALGARIGGLPGAVIGLGGSLLAPLAAQGLGNMAEKAKAQLTGEEIGGQPGSRSAASGQRAKDRAEAMKDAELQAQIAQRYGSTYLQPTLQAIQDLRQNDIDMMVQAEKRLDPIIRQRLNEQMTRQQSLNAHLAQQNAMLGTIATAGALAQGAQAETGATLRTALTANPYANSVLQAPQIKFG